MDTKVYLLGFTKPLTEKEYSEKHLNSTSCDYRNYQEDFEETQVSEDILVLANDYFTDIFPHVDTVPEGHDCYVDDEDNVFTVYYYITVGTNTQKKAEDMAGRFEQYM